MFTFEMYRIVSLMYQHHPSLESSRLLTITILTLITFSISDISYQVGTSPRTFLLIPFLMCRSENVYLCTKLMRASSGETLNPTYSIFPRVTPTKSRDLS